MSASPSTKEVIETRLQAAFSPSFMQVIDESEEHIGHAGAQGGAGHFAVTLVASQFTGLSLIKRHQMVFAILKDLIPDAIHALKINAREPSEVTSAASHKS